MLLMNYKYRFKIIIFLTSIFYSLNLNSQTEEFFIENSCGLFGVNTYKGSITWNEDFKKDLFPKFAKELMESTFWNISDDRIRFIRFSNTISSNTLVQVSLGYKTNNTNRRRIFQYDFEKTEKILSNSRYKPGNLMELMEFWETKDEPLFDLIFAINHELSHFGNGNVLHTVDCSTDESQLRIQQELDADRLAGIKCYQMGITPVVNVYNILNTINSKNSCYPDKEDRINAVRKAYINQFTSASFETILAGKYRMNSNVRDANGQHIIFSDNKGNLYGSAKERTTGRFFIGTPFLKPKKLNRLGTTSSAITFNAKSQFYGINPKKVIDTLILEYFKGRRINLINGEKDFFNDSINRKSFDQFVTRIYDENKKSVFVDNKFLSSVMAKEDSIAVKFAYVENLRKIYKLINGRRNLLRTEIEVNTIDNYPYNQQSFSPIVLNFREANENEILNYDTVVKTDSIKLIYSIYELTKQEKNLPSNYIDFGWSTNCYWLSTDIETRRDSLNFIRENLKSSSLRANLSPSSKNLNNIECFMNIDNYKPNQ